MKVTVIGGAGYVAGELVRLLLQHPQVSECVVTRDVVVSRGRPQLVREKKAS